MIALTSLVAVGAVPTIEDMHRSYASIFPTGNRNAASHRWASWILSRSGELSADSLATLFTGFCPVSGSPVSPTSFNTYHYSLPLLASPGKASGLMHHCCAPCVCDTHDMIKADTKTITLAGGVRQQMTFAVIGDPCVRPQKLSRKFTDPFTGSPAALVDHAPEVACEADGRLRGATFSDNGAVIIGLLAPAPAADLGPAPAEPTPGRPMTVHGQTFLDSREFSGYCRERAESGFNSGMGLIFRLVASVNPVQAAAGGAAGGAQPLTATPAADAAASASERSVSVALSQQDDVCSHLLPASRKAEIDGLIGSEPVLLLGMRHARCTMAASERLESVGACFRWVDWQAPSEPLWAYLKCKHPGEVVGGMEMHSYVYIGGRYVGNGFTLSQAAEADLSSRLAAANAKMSCGRDCDALASADERSQLARMMQQPLALLGWSGCPCTNIARRRFESIGACYVQTVWPTDDAPLYKYLQCKYGQVHHSFVFVGGEFVGDGFALEERRLAQPAFSSMLERAQARLTCQRKGDENLAGRPLQPCTQSNDGSTTGWTRTGSCNWDPSDSGYHEVCVTMSEQFLRASAQHDANDLSSVVSAGGHWCICAWAWASAVSRDPKSYEGITLDCDRTNLKLREVYESHIASGSDLHSPSGAAYKAKAALDAVNRVCSSGNATGSAAVAAPALAPGVAAATAAAPSATAAAPSIATASASAISSPKPAASRAGGPFVALISIFGVAAALAFVRRLARREPSLERVELTGPAAAELGPYASDAEPPDADKLGCYDSAGGESAGEEGGLIRVHTTPSTQSMVGKA